MKRRLCFRITTKLENSKRQHFSRPKKKRAGPTIQKSPRRKRKEEDKEEEKIEKKKIFFVRI